MAGPLKKTVLLRLSKEKFGLQKKIIIKVENVEYCIIKQSKTPWLKLIFRRKGKGGPYKNPLYITLNNLNANFKCL